MLMPSPSENYPERLAANPISGQVPTVGSILPSNIGEYLKASLSKNSRKAYRSDIEHFLSFGGVIPATPEMVACYLAAFAGRHAVATLCRRLVSIRKAHSAQCYASPTDTEIVRATLRGIRNTHGSAQRQVAAAVKEDVLAMVGGIEGVRGIRDRALLLVGFAGAFRRSELVGLTIDDIQQVQQGLIVQLRFSKTDQEGRGRKVAIPYARGAVCPVIALQHWLSVAGISSGHIFRSVNRHGVVAETPLSSQSVSIIIKSRAEAIGLDPVQYAGHSLRSGLVTSAAMAGVSSWKIREQTGHKSDAMLARYVRDANIFTSNAAGAVL